MSVRHDVAVPRPTSLVAARSRPGDDETLTRICAPSSASSCGTDRCQKSSQIAIPTPTPEPRRHRAQDVARGEEPALVEQAVRRQEQLAVDVPELAVLEQGRRDEQAVVGRLLDERDDGRQPAGRGGELGQARVVEPHRDLGGEVLELVAGQPELREDDEVGAGVARLAQQLVVAREVGLERARAAARSGRGRSGRSARPGAYAKAPRAGTGGSGA